MAKNEFQNLLEPLDIVDYSVHPKESNLTLNVFKWKQKIQNNFENNQIEENTDLFKKSQMTFEKQWEDVYLKNQMTFTSG